jgi:hypothetical protein
MFMFCSRVKRDVNGPDAANHSAALPKPERQKGKLKPEKSEVDLHPDVDILRDRSTRSLTPTVG